MAIQWFDFVALLLIFSHADAHGKNVNDPSETAKPSEQLRHLLSYNKTKTNTQGQSSASNGCSKSKV
jgi:hypothetical protein